MSSNSDLAVRKAEISALVDSVNSLERGLALPTIEDLYDDDRLEAMDILNRIERRMLASMSDVQPQEAAQ